MYVVQVLSGLSIDDIDYFQFVLRIFTVHTRKYLDMEADWKWAGIGLEAQTGSRLAAD